MSDAEVEFRIEEEDGIPLFITSEPFIIVKYECKKCGHIWSPTRPRPDVCPKCKNPNWGEERVYNKKDKEKDE